MNATNRVQGLLTYKEAKSYINQVKALLKSMNQLEYFIKHTEKQLKSIYALTDDVGKKGAILCYKNIRKKNPDYEAEYDEYCNNLVSSVHRARFQFKQISEALEFISNDTIKNILKYYYSGDHDMEETSRHLGYSMSSISRYKKEGLCKLAEMLYGIIITDAVEIPDTHVDVDPDLDSGLLDY